MRKQEHNKNNKSVYTTEYCNTIQRHGNVTETGTVQGFVNEVRWDTCVELRYSLQEIVVSVLPVWRSRQEQGHRVNNTYCCNVWSKTWKYISAGFKKWRNVWKHFEYGTRLYLYLVCCPKQGTHWQVSSAENNVTFL